MSNQAEIAVTGLREQLADVLNDTAVYGRITYITRSGRRVAAIVPVPVADQVSALDAPRQVAAA
jgi:antitoxin (DNA-binding transcriptional repressor) of toxin-antitoxin stability system